MTLMRVALLNPPLETMSVSTRFASRAQRSNTPIRKLRVPHESMASELLSVCCSKIHKSIARSKVKAAPGAFNSVPLLQLASDMRFS